MLNINYTRTSAARHFYFNRIVLLWNSVQPAINLNESFKVVRYKLMNFLWSRSAAYKTVRITLVTSAAQILSVHNFTVDMHTYRNSFN